jgi:hypothetical protein
LGGTSLHMRGSMFTEPLSRSGLHNPVLPLLHVGPCMCCGSCLAMDLHVTTSSIYLLTFLILVVVTVDSIILGNITHISFNTLCKYYIRKTHWSRAELMNTTFIVFIYSSQKNLNLYLHSKANGIPSSAWALDTTNTVTFHIIFYSDTYINIFILLHHYN